MPAKGAAGSDVGQEVGFATADRDSEIDGLWTDGSDHSADGQRQRIRHFIKCLAINGLAMSSRSYGHRHPPWSAATGTSEDWKKWQFAYCLCRLRSPTWQCQESARAFDCASVTPKRCGQARPLPPTLFTILLIIASQAFHKAATFFHSLNTVWSRV